MKRWYGRPNPPPLNWASPNKPVIRKVAGDQSDMLSPKPKQIRRSEEGAYHDKLQGDELDSHLPFKKEAALVSVSLSRSQWEKILEKLEEYDTANKDEKWQRSSKRIRGVLQHAVNRSHSQSYLGVAKLPLDDWRLFWKCLKMICDQDRREQWWFAGISKTIVMQIRSQTDTPDA